MGPVRTRLATAVVLGAALSACTRAPEVTIIEPFDGADVSGPGVTVRLAVTGIAIAPVAEQRAGAAHAHLYLDVPVTPPDSAIPFGVAGVVHLGGGQMEYRFDSVAPGPHRVIAVLADNGHIPVPGARADTAGFVVRAALIPQ